jgi:hypothetical protein
MFNKLPLSAIKASLNSFKIILKRWLIANPFYSVNEFLECDISTLVFN